MESIDSFLERRQALSQGIINLRAPQRLYMPGCESLLENADPILLIDHPEDVQLSPPSALPTESRHTQCVDGLPRIEYRLRFAQAGDALRDIRRFRRLIRAILTKTQSHIANTQRTSSRTRGLLEKIQFKQARTVLTYQAARAAIVKLAPNEEFGPVRATLPFALTCLMASYA